MRDTFVTLYRPENNAVVAHIPVQIDQISEKEQIDYQMVIKFHTADGWRIYTKYLLFGAQQIRRGDVLQDELTLNPETNQPYRYRVVGLVKTYDDHQEMVVATPRGN